MKRRMFSTVFFASMFLITGTLFAAGPDDVVGKYATDGGKSIVQVYKCGAQYCGKIVWLKEPNNKEGKPKLDVNNPDGGQKARPLIGMNLVWGFTHDGGNVWAGGKIYNPEDGKTYSCKMTLEGNKLNVRGYVGIAALGKTTVWTKTG